MVYQSYQLDDNYTHAHLLSLNKYNKKIEEQMVFDVKSTVAKIKYLATQTAFAQIMLFSLAKICSGIMELPHEKKQMTYIPFLIGNILLMGSAIGLKILRHKFNLLRNLAKLQAECFLLWVIGIVLVIFSWSLFDALQWGLVQIILAVLAELMSLFMLTLLTKEDFITKMEFMAYEIILGIQIIAISIKTVGFIKHNLESPHKDIVLLNLTTQIALVIILMDSIEKSYRRMKSHEVKDDMTRLENQMVFTNKMGESARNNASLRENFQLKQ